MHKKIMNQEQRAAIKPAAKVGTDASKVGIDTYQLISVVDSLPNTTTPDRTQFEQLIFQPHAAAFNPLGD